VGSGFCVKGQADQFGAQAHLLLVALLGLLRYLLGEQRHVLERAVSRREPGRGDPRGVEHPILALRLSLPLLELLLSYFSPSLPSPWCSLVSSVSPAAMKGISLSRVSSNR